MEETHWEPERIRNEVLAIRRDMDIKTGEEIKDDHLEFYNRYPKLYFSTISENFRMEHFERIMKKIEKMWMSDKNYQQGILEFGEDQARRFLYPVLGTPTVRQREQAIKEYANGGGNINVSTERR